MVNKQKIERIYQDMKDKLKNQEGNILAIDPESGDFFIGKNVLEAYHQGNKKHPNKEFFFKRIGAEHTFVVGAL